MPREDARAAELEIAAWFQQRIGTVTERYVPNQDCPAGNPFGLRHTWLTRRRAVALQFEKSPASTVLLLTLADWKRWIDEQKDFQDGWPLRPARPAEKRQAATPFK